MAFTKSSSAIDLGETSVENLFIREFLPNSNADQIKVYLTGLMHANASRDFSCGLFAYELGMSVSYVRRIFEHWRKLGLVEIVESENEQEFTVVYHSLRSLIHENRSVTPRPDDRSDSDLARLVLSLKGSQVNSREFEYLQEFVATTDGGYALAEQILTLYYKDRGGKSFLEVEKILAEIKRLEITNLQDAILLAHRVLNKREVYKRVKLQISDRSSTTAAEQAKIDQWLDEFGYSEEQIVALVAEFSTRSTNPNIAFIHKLMTEHYQTGRDDRHEFRREVKQLLTGGNDRVNKTESALIDRWLDELGLTPEEVKTAVGSFAAERQSPSIGYIDQRIREERSPQESSPARAAASSGPHPAAGARRRKKLKSIDSFSNDELEERLLARNRDKL